MMKIYCYAEHTTRKGKIAFTDWDDDIDEENISDDVFLWGDDSKENLIVQAVDRLKMRYDKRPGGAGDSFDWSCARSVLEYFRVDPESIDHELTDAALAYLANSYVTSKKQPLRDSFRLIDCDLYVFTRLPDSPQYFGWVNKGTPSDEFLDEYVYLAQ